MQCTATQGGAAPTDGSLAAEIAAIHASPSDSNLKKFGEPKPVLHDGGRVTAGNSSPLTDSASAVMVTSEAFVKKHDEALAERLLCIPDLWDSCANLTGSDRRLRKNEYGALGRAWLTTMQLT